MPRRVSARRGKTASSTKARRDKLKTTPVNEVESNWSYVFYGRSATGKTTLACTLPGPILLVDVKDDGTDSVSDVDDVHVMQPEEWTDLDDLYWTLYDSCKPYKTIVIDPITQVQQMIVEEIAASKGGSKVPGEWGSLTKQDWGNVSSKLKEWITRMKSLPVNVVFLAHERTFNAEDDSALDDDQLEPEVGPRLSPATMTHLCSSVSVIGNTYIAERVETIKVKGKKKQKITKEYRLRLGPNSFYITKLRKPKSVQVPDYLVDPSHKKIHDIIKGK